MSRRPGGELSSRPLHFIWICDCSGSMSVDGKIQSLNNALQEALPHMRDTADENPNAQVLMRALKFSHGAEWHHSKPTIVRDFKWEDLVADELAKPEVAADIVFLMDTSGSMSGEIEAVKKSCLDFANHITQMGAKVKLGLIGFDIGGHRSGARGDYTVHDLSEYTIGIWPMASPDQFKHSIQSLSLGLFGGGGCYLANRDTVDIFPHVARIYDGSPGHSKILVIISDEIGNNDGTNEIVALLKSNSITTHVLGVKKKGGAHESIASLTGGKFWDISKSKGRHDFTSLLGTVAETIAREVTKKLADGTSSSGTDMGRAMIVVADQLRIPPMIDRALPPVLVLISDGQPTDDFEAGLKSLMSQPWGKKSVRVAIGIGKDADLDVLQKFIGHSEMKPLHAGNPEALIRYIKWVSTAVLKTASSPASQIGVKGAPGGNMPIPLPPDTGLIFSDDVW
jgi:uncharacterized protein YegL